MLSNHKKDLGTFISFKHLCGKNHEMGDGHDIVAKKINLLSNEVVTYWVTFYDNFIFWVPGFINIKVLVKTLNTANF